MAMMAVHQMRESQTGCWAGKPSGAGEGAGVAEEVTAGGDD
jgi:hypothetical protein